MMRPLRNGLSRFNDPRCTATWRSGYAAVCKTVYSLFKFADVSRHRTVATLRGYAMRTRSDTRVKAFSERPGPLLRPTCNTRRKRWAC
jgi:hypothetical protein